MTGQAAADPPEPGVSRDAAHLVREWRAAVRAFERSRRDYAAADRAWAERARGNRYHPAAGEPDKAEAGANCDWYLKVAQLYATSALVQLRIDELRSAR